MFRFSKVAIQPTASQLPIPSTHLSQKTSQTSISVVYQHTSKATSRIRGVRHSGQEYMDLVDIESSFSQQRWNSQTEVRQSTPYSEHYIQLLQRS